MKSCECTPITWKGRHGYCIRNSHVKAVMLTGGGAIVDFRLCDSSINMLWEAPWPTIDPHTFDASRDERTFGSRPIGPMLAGCTGHVVAAGYFGMPPADRPDLPLHGEAACSLWTVDSVHANESAAELTMSVAMPVTGLHLERRVRLCKGASSLSIQERLRNTTDKEVAFQWVQHTMFGAPLFTGPHARLSLPAAQCITWPLGYEGHAVLEDNTEFAWPLAPSINGEQIALSHPFVQPRSGFVASVLLRSDIEAFAAISNTQLGLLAGYAFNRETYPWVALWEENCARTQSPWLGKTQVRGVEFGNSPMPLGLAQAKQQGTLFGIPTFRTLGPFSDSATEYILFATRIEPDQMAVTHIARTAAMLEIHFTTRATKHIVVSPE